MIRFVDTRSAGIAGIRFAFWDTVVDQFIEDDLGDQGWDTWTDVELKDSGRSLRLGGLCPDWAFKEPIDV